jgi:CRP-like cAMP-binding protein
MDGTITNYAAGDVIYREGDPTGDMHLIRSGSVVVSLMLDGVPTTLVTLGPGATFGEVSLFDGKPRSATVTALDDVVVEAISKEHIAGEMDSFVWDLLVRVSARIRAVDESLAKRTAEDVVREDALSSIAIRRNLYY